MREDRFVIFFVLLLIAQILISNFFDFSQWVVITFLPALILCLPLKMPSPWVIIISFVTGFIVDFFFTGMLGMTSAALLPVGFLRSRTFKILFGEEIFLRGEDLSIAKHGSVKVSFAVFLSLVLFLLILIWIDAAGTRPVWFILAKLAASLPGSFIVSLFIVHMLRP